MKRFLLDVWLEYLAFRDIVPPLPPPCPGLAVIYAFALIEPSSSIKRSVVECITPPPGWLPPLPAIDAVHGFSYANPWPSENI